MRRNKEHIEQDLPCEDMRLCFKSRFDFSNRPVFLTYNLCVAKISSDLSDFIHSRGFHLPKADFIEYFTFRVKYSSLRQSNQRKALCIVANQLLDAVASTSVPMTQFAFAVLELMIAIFITKENMCTLGTKRHHFRFSFNKLTSTFVTL